MLTKANNFARGHYTIGKEIVDLVLDRTGSAIPKVSFAFFRVFVPCRSVFFQASSLFDPWQDPQVGRQLPLATEEVTFEFSL